MAGQKMSPRQKMINMMYLVLTALLALNVSSEILNAFDSLRKSLATSAKNSDSENQSLAGQIQKQVAKEVANGRESIKWVEGSINEIDLETTAVMAFLEGVTEDLFKIGEADPVTGEITKKDETEDNFRYWLGTNDLDNQGRGNGKALELKKKLENYITWANKVYAKVHPETPKRFREIALEPSADPGVTSGESKDKTWEYYTFHNKPVVADLAMIEKFKMDVKEVETGMLNLMKEQLSDVDIVVDSIIAMDAPFSDVVAAGLNFETKLFVSMASKEVKPEFLGSGITVEPGGNMAMMKIPANGSVIPPGKSEGIQKYHAIIKLPKRSGGFYELPVEGEFKVRMPEIVVRSEVVQTLYDRCANTVTVDVPALGDQYNPDFSSSTGGQAIRKPGSVKELTLVPTAKFFTLAVHSNTNGQKLKIGDMKYTVIKTPEPEFVAEVRGKKFDGKSEVSKKESVTVKIEADKEFRERFRDDARYKVKEVRLMFKQGLGSAQTIQSKSGASIQSGVSFDLYQGQIRTAVPGDKIYFEVDVVRRVNFQGQEIEEPMDIYKRVIVMTLKN